MSRLLAALVGAAGVATWWAHGSLPPGVGSGRPLALLGATVGQPGFAVALVVVTVALGVVAEWAARRHAWASGLGLREARAAVAPAVWGPGLALAAALLDAAAAWCLAPPLLALGGGLGLLASLRRAWVTRRRDAAAHAAGLVGFVGLRSRLGVVVAAVAIPALLLPGWSPPSGDEPHYLVVSHSLWFDGDLGVADEYAGGAYRPYHPGSLSPHYKPGKLEGSRYSMHGVGLPLLVLPAYAVGRANGRGELMVALPRATLVLLYGLFALLLYGLVEAMAGRPAAAWGTAATVLLPPLLYAPLYLFPEVPAMTLACGGFALARRPRGGVVLALGFLLPAALPWLGVKYLPLAVVLAALGAWTESGAGRRRRAALYAAGLLAGLAGHALFTWWLYGSLSPMAIYLGSPAAAAPAPALGARWGEYLASWPWGLATAVGYVLDQKEGLLIYGPHFLLAAAGLPFMWKRQRRDLVALTILSAAYVGPYALSQQLGGQGPPARPLMAVLWVLAAPLGVALSGMARDRLLAAAGGALTALAAALGLVYAARPALLPHDYPVEASRLLRALSPHGAGWWKLFPQWVSVEEPLWPVAIAWLLATAGLGIGFARRGRRLLADEARGVERGAGEAASWRARKEGSESWWPPRAGRAGWVAATAAWTVAGGALLVHHLAVPVTDLHRPTRVQGGFTVWVEEELPERAWAEEAGIWVHPGEPVDFVLSAPQPIETIDVEVGVLVPAATTLAVQGAQVSGPAAPGAPLRGRLSPAPGRPFAGGRAYRGRLSADAGAAPADLGDSADERVLGAFLRIVGTVPAQPPEGGSVRTPAAGRGPGFR